MQEVGGSIPPGSTKFPQQACGNGQNGSPRPHRLEA
jgi:hypothetical protein